jgi:hypothetical protein
MEECILRLLPAHIGLLVEEDLPDGEDAEGYHHPWHAPSTKSSPAAREGRRGRRDDAASPTLGPRGLREAAGAGAESASHGCRVCGFNSECRSSPTYTHPYKSWMHTDVRYVPVQEEKAPEPNSRPNQQADCRTSLTTNKEQSDPADSSQPREIGHAVPGAGRCAERAHGGTEVLRRHWRRRPPELRQQTDAARCLSRPARPQHEFGAPVSAEVAVRAASGGGAGGQAGGLARNRDGETVVCDHSWRPNCRNL